MEEWRDIQDFIGYQVSNFGRVRSFVNNRHGVGETFHMLKSVLNRQGYETVMLGRKNRRLVHRLVAIAFIPNPHNYPIVRHLDDNPLNNTVANLAWGTQADNMQDCVKHGRLVRDTTAAVEATKKKVIAASLDGKQVFEFPSMNEAARTLKVWPQHISSVAHGRLRQTGGYYFELAEEES